MRSLAKYFYEIVKKEYQDWCESNKGSGIPGRFVLKEFDANLVEEIINNINSNHDFPIKPLGSDDGFIVVVEKHEQYQNVEIDKHSFSEMAHERNREGNFFCLMLMAEIKPTMEQVRGIDQSTVFEQTEITKWVELAKRQHTEQAFFIDEYVAELSKFVSELTNSKWNARPFIEIDKINAFIDGVIEETIRDGKFYYALGKSCVHLGGINRLEEFLPLKNSGGSYRRMFRSIVTKTLFKDINFWRAINKDKEVELSEIKNNIDTIKQSGNDYDEFCIDILKYFTAFYQEDRKLTVAQKQELQKLYDCSFPYPSVLQVKSAKPKFLLGAETQVFLADNDIDLEEEYIELLGLVDNSPSQKPEINDLRKFYFSYSKDISENSKLDKAWLKEITGSKITECNDLITGLLEVLSKSVLLNDLGDDEIVLSLAKDRTRRSLERKNWYAINYFNNEYKDLASFWSQFGDNFKVEFGKVFNEGFASSVDSKNRKNGESKAVNELSFRVIRRKKGGDDLIDSWELKWIFNPYGFESSKYLDFAKISDRKGFFHKYDLSLDPLFIKRAESTPTITNIHMFLAVSTSMKKGAVVKKSDKETDVFEKLLEDLKNHNHLSHDGHTQVMESFSDFFKCWKNTADLFYLNPLCSVDDELEVKLRSLIELIYSLSSSKEINNALVYELLSAHTINVTENANYCIYLPWSPYSLLMQSQRNLMLKNISSQFANKSLSIANKSDGVLAKLFRELFDNNGKSLFLKKLDDNSYSDLVSTNSKSGYYEFGKLSTSKNAINDSEIKSVINATAIKFLETYPNERHHLQILCIGLTSYEHLLSVYDELLKISDNHEEQLSISLVFNCSNRKALDSVYQTICESFDTNRVDSNITIRIVNDIDEVEDGEIDLIYNFDPLFAHNKVAEVAPQYIQREFDALSWEYCASRKVPSDPIARKTQFSMNNHVNDSKGQLFLSTFLKVNNRHESTSFCREVSQVGLKDEISKGLSKCNWLIIYDYLLSKETLNACSENDPVDSSDNSRRVLRYIQGEGSKRSLAIITDKETQYITKNLNSDMRDWQLVHPEKVEDLVDKIFSMSNSFSSDTLLRSVGNGKFSHDLVGTAGAAWLLESIYDKDSKISDIFWVHLDDYLSWFKSSIEDDAFKSIGRTVNYISDLLGIYIYQNESGVTTINLIVSESKLTNGSTEQSVKSCKQVKSTVDLISSMLRSYEDIDFEYWLNKFYEFIVGHFKFDPSKFEFYDLIALDKKAVNINVSGLSVVFHYDNAQVGTSSDVVFDTDYLCQLKLSSSDTKQVFQSLVDESPLRLFDRFNFSKLSLNKSINTDSLIDNNDKSSTKSERLPENSSATLSEVEENVSNVDSPEPTTVEYTKALEKGDKRLSEEKSSLEIIKHCIGYLETNIDEIEKNEIDINSIKANIRKIFGHANLPSNFSESLVTPNSIVIKLHGDVNLSPSKVLKLKDNFLSVVGLSLRRVYPDKGVMVLVFDRDKRATVYFGKLLNNSLEERKATIEQDFNNKIMLGQDEFSESSVFFKLDGASPHALIGGQTKSGKSILMNNMIIDLLMTNSPDNLKLRLFDPKQVEFAAYSKAPHLAHPVVLNKEEAVERLKELESLMNERYTHLMTLNVKDFEAYNRKYPSERMSREVVFFDELADWILDNAFKAEAKDIIVRLSSKGRAAGIHLVLATQRPSADVVFPLLRANLDTKIALKVDRDQNSEIILGESGAESLLGYGHGIVKTEGETYSIQVGFTDTQVFDGLVEKVVEYWS